MRPSIESACAIVFVALLPAAVPGTSLAATASARYSVRFDATWSAVSHPLGFPASAHWSPLIGGTHDAGVDFWSPGTLASPGIRDMAELGRTTPLDTEVQTAINNGHADAIVRGSGLPASPGSTSVTVTLTQQFPRLTLVSMIAPSPDWFAGVGGLELFRDGDWREQVVVPLYAYDAGTDSGVNYTSPNQTTLPPQPVSLNNAASFQNGTPVGLLTLTRIDVPNSSAVPATSAWMLLCLGALVLAGGERVLRLGKL